MKTAEELFDELPVEPGPGKLNWIEYKHACLAKLVAWQNEILEAAALVADEHWAECDNAPYSGVIPREIRNLKAKAPPFSYGGGA